MLRVLTLSTLFPTASRPNFGVFVERQTLALAARKDVAIKVVAPVGVPPGPLARLSRYRDLADLPRRETWAGLDVARPRFVNLPGTRGRFHGATLARAVAPLLLELRASFPFDLIAAEYFFPDGVAAARLGERFGVPVTIKARGSDIHRWAHEPAVARQIRAAAARATRLIAVSQAMRRDMIALGMDPARIDVSYTGVDQARFAPVDRSAARAALGVEGPLVVAVGALVAVKGHDLLIDAIAQLPGVALWIAGEGPERPSLERRIEALGIGTRVRLLGAVARDEVAPLVAAADVMALASHSEGLANAWVEALASGTPVIVPDVGGAREVVAAPAAGRVVERTAKAFAEAIAAIVAAPPEQAAVRAAAAHFTWPATAAHLVAVYRSAIADFVALRSRAAA